jgi:hypothetical protein
MGQKYLGEYTSDYSRHVSGHRFNVRRLPHHFEGQKLMSNTDKVVEIKGKRLQVTARAAGIDFKESYYWKNSRFPKRVVAGILVSKKDEKSMLRAIAARDSKRKTAAQKTAARLAKQEKETQLFKAEILVEFCSMPDADAEECARYASAIGSARVGRSLTAENPARSAVVAYVRHNMTEYDSLLVSGVDREEARRIVAPKIRETLERWEA